MREGGGRGVCPLTIRDYSHVMNAPPSFCQSRGSSSKRSQSPWSCRQGLLPGARIRVPLSTPRALTSRPARSHKPSWPI